jgi:carbamate kinase
MTAAAQRTNVRLAAEALADLARDHQIVVAHGNGPQVGLLALQGAAYDPGAPMAAGCAGRRDRRHDRLLDRTGADERAAQGFALRHPLSRVEVDPLDPAFQSPSKPIGPVYSAAEAAQAASDHGWDMVEEASGGLRRVVASPAPLRIIGLDAVKALLDADHCVICAGGGGIPVMRNAFGEMEGVEAVIDKDRTSAMLALGLEADALLLLTDVAAVMRDFGGPDQSPIAATTPAMLDELDLAPGSMGPKVAAASAFVRASGNRAGIGRLADARAILERTLSRDVMACLPGRPHAPGGCRKAKGRGNLHHGQGSGDRLRQGGQGKGQGCRRQGDRRLKARSGGPGRQGRGQGPERCRRHQGYHP